MLPVADEDQRAIVAVARRFSEERLAPDYQKREAGEGRIDPALLREMGSLGLIAPAVSAELGGAALDCATTGLVIEALAAGDFNIAYIPLIGSLMAELLSLHARPQVAGHWVPRIIAGDAIVGVALTEPRGGSDAANLVVRAEKVESGYRLSGEKASITAVAQAEAFVVFARTGRAADAAKGVSAFLLPSRTKGVSFTRFDDLGGKVLGRGSLFLDDAFVPADHRLGEEGGGFSQVMRGFDFTRALLGLQCVGAAQASLQETWRYVDQREAFGRKIGDNQGVAFPLAEGETMLEAVRQLCLHALRLRDRGQPHSAEAAMCKWLAPKTAVDVIHRCLITHGHYGWSLDLPHQQRLRDAMGMEIGDGTEQIMKMIIARHRSESSQG
jgi:cyclohexanecarboxyl-CoA dehydrogenase